MDLFIHFITLIILIVKVNVKICIIHLIFYITLTNYTTVSDLLFSDILFNKS